MTTPPDDEDRPTTIPDDEDRAEEDREYRGYVPRRPRNHLLGHVSVGLLRYGAGLAVAALVLWLMVLVGNWAWLALLPAGWAAHRLVAWVRDNY